LPAIFGKKVGDGEEAGDRYWNAGIL